MRLIDADRFKENILSGLYIYCQENKEDIARAIDDEPTITPNLELFKEWKCADCEEREKSFYDGWQSAKERFERPQGEWIPISERLPEFTGLYLVSVDDVVTVASFTGIYFMHKGGGRVKVYAWQPLPEPYKADMRGKKNETAR